MRRESFRRQSLVNLLRKSTGKIYRGKLLSGWSYYRVDESGMVFVEIRWEKVPSDLLYRRYRGISIPLYLSVGWSTAFSLWLLSWRCKVGTDED